MYFQLFSCANSLPYVWNVTSLFVSMKKVDVFWLSHHFLHVFFPWKRTAHRRFCFRGTTGGMSSELSGTWLYHILDIIYIYIFIMYKYYKSVQNFKAQVYLCIYTWHVGRLELWSFRRSGFGTCSMGRVAQPRLGGLGHGAYGWVQPWEWPHMLGYKPSKYIQIYIYIYI
jgi:hypothetical protein